MMEEMKISVPESGNEAKKPPYERVRMEIIRFSEEDVITASTLGKGYDPFEVDEEDWI